MATLSHWSGFWTSAGHAYDFQPGEVHSWVMWGFDDSDSITVTAQPIVGNPLATRVLQVDHVQVEADVGGRRLFYSVTNTGTDSIPSYAMNFGYISP